MVAWSRSLKSQMSLKAFGKLTTDDVVHLCSGIQLEWTHLKKKKLFTGQAVGHVPYKVDVCI